MAAIKGRPAHETLDSLRLTLLKIEQSAEHDKDAEAMVELKRILLRRIAELEAIQAVESASAQSADEPQPADLVAPASVKADDSQSLIVDADLSIPPAELE